MLIPASKALVGVIGASWDVQFQLFEDEAQTVGFDLTIYDAGLELQIDGVATLALGSGLTLASDSSSVQSIINATMTPTQTRVRSDTNTQYRLKCSQSNGRVDYPLDGLIQWTQP